MTAAENHRGGIFGIEKGRDMPEPQFFVRQVFNATGDVYLSNL
jgi:hypothetical protein